MNHYPDYHTYETLYSRFVNGRDESQLLELLAPLQGARVLDLCCGKGTLTLKALEAGANSVVAVDAEPKMMTPALIEHPNVKIFETDVGDALQFLRTYDESFDRVVCRQAINYWLDEETVELTAAILIPEGIFAFNTFNEKPTEKPHAREYELENRTFVEVNWMIDEMVHHLQVCEGMTHHHTVFRWLSPEHIHTILEPFFIVTEHRHGKTSLYQCRKRRR